MPLKQRKIAVMGSRSVGKSSLVIQFVQVAGDDVIIAVAVILIVLVDVQLDLLVLVDPVAKLHFTGTERNNIINH